MNLGIEYHILVVGDGNLKKREEDSAMNTGRKNDLSELSGKPAL